MLHSRLVSGVLNAKSGHDASHPTLAYDLMTFTYFYRRAPGTVSFASVQAWHTQYQQTSPTYSSLIRRRSLVDLGFSAWQRR